MKIRTSSTLTLEHGNMMFQRQVETSEAGTRTYYNLYDGCVTMCLDTHEANDLYGLMGGMLSHISESEF